MRVRFLVASMGLIAILALGSLACSLADRASGDQTPAGETGGSTPPAAIATQPPVAESPAPQAPQDSYPPPAEPAVETAPAPAPVEEVATCEADSCVLDGSFWLARPFGTAGRSDVDGSARYGSYRQATRSGRHGASFVNSRGTPVLAVASGSVVVAGDDRLTAYGSYTGQYGNLVILEHHLPQINVPIYTLYAHLDEITVRQGDQVQVGDEIGKVGASGDTAGSRLYFEVRYGENSFSTVRNPELWMALRQGGDGQTLGAVAGRIVDGQQKYLAIPNIVLERLAGPGLPAQDTLYAKTYAEKRLMGLEPWGESFALGDIPPGEYQVSFYTENGALVQRIVEVQPGKLTFIVFEVP